MTKNNIKSINFQLGMDFNFLGIEFTGIVEETNNIWKLAAFKADKSINLSQVVEKILSIDLPDEIPDVLLEDLNLFINSEKEIRLNSIIKLKEEVFIIGNQELNIAALEFNYDQSKESKGISISLMGRDIPKIDEIDAQIKEYKFEFQYKKQKNEKADWHIGGALHIEAFERLMSFNVETTQLGESSTLSFRAGLESIVMDAYFSDIKGLDYDVLKKELSEQGILVMPDKQQDNCQLKDSSEINSLKLSKSLSLYRNQIIDALLKIKNANKPLITIPDLLNNNKPLFVIDPIEFNIKLVRKNNKFEEFFFSITSSLTLYNTMLEDSKLLNIENGTLVSLYNRTNNEFKLCFTAEKAEIKPLNVVSLIPGMNDAMHALYNDVTKEEAFMNMLSINLNEAHFIKKGNEYDVGGSVKLCLNDGLKIVNEDLYNTLDTIFPKTGKERFIKGSIAYTSDSGLVFELINNNGIEIPSLFHEAVKGIPTELKKQIKDDIHFDLDTAFDYGESFILLERIRLAINSEVTLEVTVAFGLPSKLNDRLFATSELNGIISTYDRELLKSKEVGVSDPFQEDAYSSDNLSRVTLSVGTEGITGRLDKFDIINREKLNEITKGLTGFIIEEDKAIIIDFDILANDKAVKDDESQYGKISIDKPKFSLDLKTGAFTASGGFEILSDHLRLPVRGVVEKMSALLPLNENYSKKFEDMITQLSDGISIKSMDFIKDNILNIGEIEDFFKQFLLKEYQEVDIFDKNLKELIKKESGKIVKYFPERFQEYLSIKLPKGLHYEIEISADKSISFQLEVSESEKNNDFSDCIQLLVPTGPINWYGIRLKKIGFGTALFNQCFRLDLSVEIDQFNLPEMIAGIGITELRGKEDEKLNFILPDPDDFCQTFEANNLMVLIFMLKIPPPVPLVIPIPVPMFYDKLYSKSCGIVGGGAEFNIELPAPELDIMKAFKELSDCINFFKDKDTVLSVPSHALAKMEIENEIESLFRPLEAGPIYIELPGIFGYEKEDEFKKKIMLGFSTRLEFHALDMIHLLANALKYSVLSLKEKKMCSIPVDGTDLREYPVNYLVKYLPDTQRIGHKNIVLFDLFNITFAWALSTPDEFRKTVFPLLIKEQGKYYLPYKADLSKDGDKLLEILPKADKPGETTVSTPGALTQDEQGVVLFFKGAFKVGEFFGVDVALGTVLAESTGLATGVEFNAHIANVFQMHFIGAVKVNPESKTDIFMIAGTSAFKLWGKDVMKGSFELATGNESHIKFSGLLDLFPDELFPPNEPSPIQLYTGESKGSKSPVIGRMDKKGIYYQGGIHLELGSFYLGGSTELIANEKQNMWELTLSCNNSKIVLEAREKNDLLVLSGWADSAIKIGNDISITAASSGTKGPKTIIRLKRVNGLPVLDSFQFDGAISIFGNSSKTLININHNDFSLYTKTETAGIGSSLKVTGKNLLDIISYHFSGTLDLTKFNNFVEGLLDPFQTNKKDELEKLMGIRKNIADFEKIKSKKAFIEKMDKKYYTKRYVVEWGYNYVVPPVIHVEYWKNKKDYLVTQNIIYTQEDVRDVRKYWQYRKDLKLKTEDPIRLDPGRWIKGTADGLVDLVNTVENKILKNIKKISNDFNHLLKDLHIDLKQMDQINNIFNQKITELEKLNNELAQCIKDRKMIIKIEQIEYSDLSCKILKSNKFKAKVTYSFLKKEGLVFNNMSVNLLYPERLLRSICQKVLSL